MTTKQAPDITRIMLSVLCIGILIAATVWIMRPFLSSLVWAAMIVIATWPLMLNVQGWLWGKRGLATLVMTVVLLLVFVAPLSFAITTILGRAGDIVAWVNSLTTISIPPPPDWLGNIPLVGKRAVERWQQFAAISPQELSTQLAPYAKSVVTWFVDQAGSFGLMVLQFLLTVAIAAILYVNGETAAGGVCSFARRLAGERGEEAAILSAKAIRGVALGIVVTALIQATLGGVGLFVAGVPAAILLSAVMFLLCIAQVGPGLVLIPAVIWLFWSDQTMWGVIMTVWSLFVGTIDNFIRPVLIKRGADLPLLLILVGVIGGLIAFGIIGLFIGPVILAVTYTLLRSWVTGNGEEEPPLLTPPTAKGDDVTAPVEQ